MSTQPTEKMLCDGFSHALQDLIEYADELRLNALHQAINNIEHNSTRRAFQAVRSCTMVNELFTLIRAEIETRNQKHPWIGGDAA